ncbi:MAG: hypothetical protein Q4P06_02530 [Actinomycetaceae bacterium]|nr:hypothetical protein [Actinomycetaceae bacterium]
MGKQTPTDVASSNEDSRNLDRLLRDTRRRLYAAAAASDYEVFGHILTLPDSEADAMEQRLQGGLRSAELDHRRAVARLAKNETPLPFADAAADYRRANAETDCGAAEGDYRGAEAVSEHQRQQMLHANLSQFGLTQLGFKKGLPVGVGVKIRALPEDVIVVIAPHAAPENGYDTAQRLASRLLVPAQIVRAGARTVNPGSGLRARTAEEVDEIRAQHPDSAVIVVVVNSEITSHQRNANRIVESLEPVQTWVCVDGRADAAAIIRATQDLPGGLEPDALAVTHLWEAPAPGTVLEAGIPVGLIDGAPSSDELWALVASDADKRRHQRKLSKQAGGELAKQRARQQ